MEISPLEEWLSDTNRTSGECIWIGIPCWLFSIHGFTANMRLFAERNLPIFLPLFVHPSHLSLAQLAVISTESPSEAC